MGDAAAAVVVAAWAVRTGDLQLLQDMLRAFPDATNSWQGWRDPDELSLLHLACQYHSSSSFARVLLDAGFDPNILDYQQPPDDMDDEGRDQWTPLCYSGHSPELVALLLEAGANARYVSFFGVTALHKARAGPVGLLVAAGADVDVMCVLDGGGTPLQHAASRGDAKCVKALLQHGADPNGSGGEPPLCAAVLSGSSAAVKLLLSAPGIVVDCTDYERETPLMLAVKYSRERPEHEVDSILWLLLGAGAAISIEGEEGRTMLHLAAECRARGHVWEVLLQHQQQLQAIDSVDRETGQTALMDAAQWGEPMIVQLLIRAGADVGRCNSYGGSTALHCVGSAPAASKLIDAAGTICLSWKDRHGCTPLHMVRRAEVCQLLLSRGTHILAAAADYKGRLPLHTAAARAAEAGVVGLLIAANPGGVHAVDAAGQTPLHAAAVGARQSAREAAMAAELLLQQRGVVVDAFDAHKRTPLIVLLQQQHLQRGWEHSRILDTLLAAGADLYVPVPGTADLVTWQLVSDHSPAVAKQVLDWMAQQQQQQQVHVDRLFTAARRASTKHGTTYVLLFKAACALDANRAARMHADVLAFDLPALSPLQRDNIAVAMAKAWVQAEQCMQTQAAQAAEVQQEKEAARHLLVAAALHMR